MDVGPESTCRWSKMYKLALVLAPISIDGDIEGKRSRGRKKYGMFTVPWIV